MAERPVFVATHPRACSTAFERVFMTSRDRLVNVHEPFGDAFYFGPERLGTRYANDEKARNESGFADSTFKSVFDDILAQGNEGKRVFIKDIAHYLSPPNGAPASIAPSLQRVKRGVGTSADLEHTATNGDKAANLPYLTEPEPGNPTVVPSEVLRQFHFAFLIRHPKHSIPSYWRCTIPPLDSITGFYDFMPEEAGYDELRRIFDYMKDSGIVGPAVTGRDDSNGTTTTNGHTGSVPITLVDADDLLASPDAIMRQFCAAVGIDYSSKMLEWDTPEDHAFAKDKFEKWKGFHEDAINSSGLHAREHGKPETTMEQDFAEWKKRYGEEAARVIKDTVERCLPDYEYLKQFALRA